MPTVLFSWEAGSSMEPNSNAKLWADDHWWGIAFTNYYIIASAMASNIANGL